MSSPFSPLAHEHVTRTIARAGTMRRTIVPRAAAPTEQTDSAPVFSPYASRAKPGRGDRARATGPCAIAYLVTWSREVAIEIER
jgi:hypothetical protein